MMKNQTEEQERIADEVGNLRCISCKHCGKSCKRFDGVTIVPYRPYFKCETSAMQDHIICSDFEFNGSYPYAESRWCGFEMYWDAFKACWLPKGDNATVSFWLNGDTDIAYAVNVNDFAYGRMFDAEGDLNYTYKWYHTRNHGIVYEYNQKRLKSDV